MEDKIENSFLTFFAREPVVLMEAAVIERIRRSAGDILHHQLLNAPLIYHDEGRRKMQTIYQEYIHIAESARLPVFLCTPTWRTDHDRVIHSGWPTTINEDAVRFMQEIRSSNGTWSEQIKIGGLIGCKNDCYRPDEALSSDEAAQYHLWQIEALVRGGVDFMIAETLPHRKEALGIANALSRFPRPYFISFVIGRDGKMLDGSSLFDSIREIDALVPGPPVGYLINCAHPTFLQPQQQPPGVFGRLKGYLANASALDHCELDGSEILQVDDVQKWSEEMILLHQNYGVKILGGCCGTDGQHLRAMTGRLNPGVGQSG